jgi:hypothetical protein
VTTRFRYSEIITLMIGVNPGGSHSAIAAIGGTIPLEEQGSQADFRHVAPNELTN